VLEVTQIIIKRAKSIIKETIAEQIEKVSGDVSVCFE
jgi:hypothetical protein